MNRYLLLWLALLNIHCTQPKPEQLIAHPPKLPKTSALKVTNIKSPKWQGELYFTLSKGGLTTPLNVPLFLDFSKEDNSDDKCSLHTTFRVIPMYRGRYYIAQNNLWCGDGMTCVILDVQTRRFTEPKGGCIHGEELSITSIEHIEDHRYLIISAAEGFATAQIITYTPERGQKNELVVGLGRYHELEVKRHPTGHHRYTLITACPLPDGCDVNTKEKIPIKHYDWSPNTKPIRINTR